jgi:hypothetical protein
MRVPPVNERVKGAPVSMLRAMFAGIGSVLRTTDKIRGKSEAGPVDPEKVVSDTSAPATAPAAAAETAVAETAVPETAAPESVAAAPTVTEEVAADAAVATATAAAPAPAAAETKPKTAAKPRAAAKPKPATAAPEAAPLAAGGHVRLLPADEVPVAPAEAAPEPAAAAAAAPAAASGAELPLANYDELSVASLRARLRNLSADQLGQLIAYEKDHAAREDVITMFERRIAKLAEG